MRGLRKNNACHNGITGRILPLFFLCITSFLLSLPPLSATAQEGMTYTRTIITIIPAPSEENPSPTLLEKESDEETQKAPSTETPEKKLPGPVPIPLRQPITLEVDVRPESIMHMEGMINRQPFSASDGMLVLLDPPRELAPGPAGMASAVDIFYIAPDGIITEILPQVNTADLTDDLIGKEITRAFLYLPMGSHHTRDIRPGDRIEHAYFKPRPKVIQ